MIPWLALQVPIVIGLHFAFPKILELRNPYPLCIIAAIAVTHVIITYAAAAEEARAPATAWRVTIVIFVLNSLLLGLKGSQPLLAILIPGVCFYAILAGIWRTMQT